MYWLHLIFLNLFFKIVDLLVEWILLFAHILSVHVRCFVLVKKDLFAFESQYFFRTTLEIILF
jgi:hypothetical protein